MDLLQIAARVALQDTESGIRSKGKRFNLSEFKALPDSSAMHEYANSRLEHLGRGSSRTVYALTSNKVLKIAASLYSDGTSEAGIAQNKAEVDVYTNPDIKPIVVAIYDADSNYRWLISEIVRPLNSSSEFRNLTGLDLHDLIQKAVQIKRKTLTINEALKELAMDWDADDYDNVDLSSFGKEKELFLAVVGLLKYGLEHGDLGRYDHWGKTKSGRIVILDYGFTTQVADEYYFDNSNGSSD